MLSLRERCRVAALAILAVFCFISSPLFSAEYIVSADGSGDFTTITACVGAMNKGDICSVKAGDYDERIVIPDRLTGTAQAKTIFRSDPPHAASMRGFDTRRAQYIRIEGFDITNTYTTSPECMGIFIRSNNIEVVNNYFHHLRSYAICGYWEQPWAENVWVVGNRAYMCQAGINICGINWLVEDNEVERLYSYGSQDCDYSRFFGENLQIRNNHFFGTVRSEIGSSHTDGFQTFDNNGEYARNVVIEGNRVSDCYQGMMANATFYGDSSDIVISNNIFSDCWAWGLDLHEIQNFTIVHNLFANTKPHGIGIRRGASASIRNNIFYNAGSTYWSESDCQVQAEHNLIYSNESVFDRRAYPNDLLNVNPDFLNAWNKDFRLKPESPAVDAGRDVGVLTDIVRTIRPLGSAVDIGPYEYIPVASVTSKWQNYR